MSLSERTIKTVPGAPTANYNAYALVVRSTGDIIRLAGWMGDDPETGKIVDGGVEAQAEQVMKNIKACLEAAGSGLTKIVRRRMYFMDIKNDIKPVMDVWNKYVDPQQAVSTAVQVSGLAKEGALIEIEVEAKP